MIEAEVHYSLHNFLRSHSSPSWSHHLTMARLVARALRVGRSALMQVGAASGYQGRYRLSYLAPALMWTQPVVLVAEEKVQQRIKEIEIPRLQDWLGANKAIRTGDIFPDDNFQGLFITSPSSWLSGQLDETRSPFPPNIPTIIDGADDLEDWVRKQLTLNIYPQNWDELMLDCPWQKEAIRTFRVQIAKSIFQRPVNPYECYLISPDEREILVSLYKSLESHCLPPIWRKFGQDLQAPNQLLYARVVRSIGLFSIHSSPVQIAQSLAPIWSKQPVVLVASAIEQEATAPIFRQSIGLEDVTTLKFSDDRQTNLIQLYLPNRLPLPNTPEYQSALIDKLHSLLSLSTTNLGLTVILVGDVPLKAQVGTILAAEFGSRVQVEKTCLDDNGILVSGWEFWQQHQEILPAPQLVVVSTLPLPSLENPLVAGRVDYYRKSHLDWFRLYLLPKALTELTRAVAPVRDRQGIVALLDSRVLHRSYGVQVLTALSPCARVNYLDSSLFTNFKDS
ncbi:MAG: ATP-dependent DNA helicase [Chroococcus sp. CMT-3BRIN-NPC107]|nr:ATP-dependent DNA helicase [Chroococcus sp. CMT-3BRIN-NPC107]